MMEKAKLAVIGCGNVSPTYLYVLSRNPRAEVVSVTDTDLGKAVQQAAEFNVKKVYQKHEDVSQDNPNAVVILTPHYEHPSQTIFFARKRMDLLCEKPLATNPLNLEEMIQVCQKEGIKFSTMLQRRCYPNTIAAREIIEQESLGEISSVRFNFNCYKSKEFYSGWRATKKTGGGVLMSQSLHRIDQLVYIFGNPLAVEGKIEITRDYLEIDDRAIGKVYFEKDIVAEIDADNSFLGPENKKTNSTIEIIGSKGRILLSDDLTPVWEVPGVRKPYDTDINAVPTIYRPAYYGPCHEIIINDFVDAVCNDRAPMIRGEDSLPCMSVIFGFYESAQKGGAIVNLK